MTFWTYILRCADGTYYTGHTDDLERRIAQHDAGAFPGYTHDRRPVTLMWSENFQTRIEALEREGQIKDWSRKKKEALFQGNWPAVSAAAKSATPSRDRENETALPTVRFEPVENKALVSRQARTKRIGEDATVEGAQESTAPPPVIILVRPQLGENIGKAARAMLNFGLTELRLVLPRDGWPNPAATAAASGADRVLADAKLYATLAEATVDCAHVYATTVRKRGVAKPVVTPEQAATAIHAAPGRAAILFGPERSGLETDDVAVARTIITVPINPEFGSLNLAQAVILVAYEWSKGVALAQPTLVEPYPPALQDELDGMIGHLDRILVSTGHYFPPERAPVDRRQLRGILTRPGWTAGEVRTLRGVLRSIERKLTDPDRAE
ncbi:TrmJ/YjtD family RNA methyltransferase [Sphingomonas montana]|uniref:TrmJ/YjtD family RNA methyltransferase n=1 Tax=Sphingomonas montana TaxID=1843236 RepID=UPI00096D6292|nr:TrmJ/YjtD family RNA methyltransferase [Sphingomonas montana]